MYVVPLMFTLIWGAHFTFSIISIKGVLDVPFNFILDLAICLVHLKIINVLPVVKFGSDSIERR